MAYVADGIRDSVAVSGGADARPPQVLTAMDALEKRICSLQALAAQLEERAERVLRPDGLAQAGKLAESAQAPKAVLAHQLEALEDRAAEVEYRLSSILQRLEV